MNNNVISMVRKQINGTDIYKEDWKNIKGTNCYSYALCNDLSVYELKKLDESFDYFVGIFSDSAEYIDDCKDLEEAFYKDMNVLNFRALEKKYVKDSFKRKCKKIIKRSILWELFVKIIKRG